MKSNISKKIESLRAKIKLYDEWYYKKNKPLVSDFDYDLMIKELEQLENDHNQIDLFSPTQNVGSDLNKGREKVLHQEKMLSISNSYSHTDLVDFDKKVKKFLNINSDIEYCVEHKIDGASISIKYQQGKILYAATRGDGRVGDEVTANVLNIKEIPEWNNELKDFELRGEIFMNFADFEKLNLQRMELGLDQFANPRNSAAGSLKILDSKEAAKRPLKVFIYYISGDDLPVLHSERIRFLKDIKLPVPQYFKVCKGITEVIEECKIWENKKNELLYPIDGMVIKVNDTSLYSRLGTTAKSPHWLIAYKFAPERARTKLNDITLQVGRTGVVTPVAELDPVELAGTVVKRATLHNFDELIEKDIRVGDFVDIEKAGEIIPQVVKVHKEERSFLIKPFELPKICPSCSKTLVKLEDEVALRCINSSCPAQLQRKLEHFVGKGAFDISGLGSKVLKQLLSAGLIKSIPDIFKLNAEGLVNLERMGAKSIRNLLDGIERAKRVSLDNFIYALGIRYVGKGAAEKIAIAYKSLDNFLQAEYSSLSEIDEIGEKIASSVVTFLNSENRDIIEELKEQGVNPEIRRMSEVEVEFPLAGKTMVLTGALKNSKREELSQKLKSLGVKVSSSVSKKTDYLLAGENAGSKLKKAKDLSVEIIFEDNFFTKYGEYL